MKKSLLILLLLITANILAEDIYLKDGKAFINIKIISEDSSLVLIDLNSHPIVISTADIIRIVRSAYNSKNISEMKIADPPPNEKKTISLEPTKKNRSNQPSSIINRRISKIQPAKLKQESDYLGSIQCKAITEDGTQCKRSAENGSDYCWQHRNYRKELTTKKTSNPNYRVIYTGPRGGKYYINSKGNKVYIRKKK